jgi:hypothetical protein
MTTTFDHISPRRLEGFAAVQGTRGLCFSLYILGDFPVTQSYHLWVARGELQHWCHRPLQPALKQIYIDVCVSEIYLDTCACVHRIHERCTNRR